MLLYACENLNFMFVWEELIGNGTPSLLYFPVGEDFCNIVHRWQWIVTNYYLVELNNIWFSQGPNIFLFSDKASHCEFFILFLPRVWYIFWLFSTEQVRQMHGLKCPVALACIWGWGPPYDKKLCGYLTVKSGTHLIILAFDF